MKNAIVNIGKCNTFIQIYYRMIDYFVANFKFLMQKKIMKKILILSILLCFIFENGVMGQNDIQIIQTLDLENIPNGKVNKYYLHLINNGLGQPVYVPIIVAKGMEDGPTLAMVAAIHGNELNGIPIIQNIFKNIDPTKLKGILIGVPGLNVVSIDRDRRRFVDEEDLNRNFPGKEKGNRSQQYVYKIKEKILPHFDYLVDMHTASFGRLNSLYVRADLRNDTIAQMAHLQDCDIILNSKGVPSTGDDLPMLRTFRAEAMIQGIPTITVEYGNPQVYQKDMIERGEQGMQNIMSWLKMIETPIEVFSKKPIACKKSFWIYVDVGGLLEIPVELNQVIKKGDLIGVVRNPFGDILKKYYSPEDGVVIGKSSNPINMDGGRIIHLGIKK
jgi:predicted deacylase